MRESFFATLECELLDQKPLRSQVQARIAVFDFIEGYPHPEALRDQYKAGVLGRFGIEPRDYL